MAIDEAKKKEKPACLFSQVGQGRWLRVERVESCIVGRRGPFEN